MLMLTLQYEMIALHSEGHCLQPIIIIARTESFSTWQEVQKSIYIINS